MNFRQWFSEVNSLCQKVTGLSVSDFEDYTWRDAYEDDLSPGAALYDFLYENRYVQRYPELFESYMDKGEIA